MQSLSKEAEQKLIAAIEKAAALVNDGMTPNAAIIKSAAAANVPAGHINLMVHAYNTGRTTKQREQGESALEKAADFQLADAQTVMEALYPKTVKTSAEIVRQQVVSTEYALSPAGMLARRRAEQEKAAAASAALPEKTWTPPPRDERAAVLRAQSEKIAKQRAEEENRRQATASYSKAAAALDELSVYFRTPGNMPFGDALREVNLRFGAQGSAVLQKVAAVYPYFEKQAATKQHRFGHDRVYDLVQNVITSVESYNDAQSRVSVKKSNAVCKNPAPEFFTGSVLNYCSGAPLELKQAWNISDKDPDTSTPYSGRTSFGKNDRDIKKPEPLPIPPLPRHDGARRPKEPTSPKTDSLAAYLDALMPQSIDPSSWSWGVKEKYGPTDDDADFQRALLRNKADLDAGRAEDAARENKNQRQRMLDEAHEFEQNERRDVANKDINILNPFGDGPPMPPSVLDQVGAGGMSAARGLRDAGKSFARGWSSSAPKNPTGAKDILNAISSPVKTVGKHMGMSQGTLSEIAGLDKKPDDVKRQQFASLSNPEHENELRSIRTRGILHDLILNDPVVAGHDPAEVAIAFNDISEVAPNLIDSPGVLRAMLRKRLEGGELADFDLKQLLEMDKLRLERDNILADTKKTEQSLL